MILRSQSHGGALVVHKTWKGHSAALKKYRPDAVLHTLNTSHEWCIALRPTFGPGETAPTSARAIERAARVT